MKCTRRESIHRHFCYVNIHISHRVPGEIMSREVELGGESWTFFASSCSSTAVQRTLSLWLPSTAVETATAQCIRSLRSFSGGIRGQAFTLSPSPHTPPPTPSLSLIINLASVDVKQYSLVIFVYRWDGLYRAWPKWYVDKSVWLKLL